MKETLLEKELKRFNNILGYKYYLKEDDDLQSLDDEMGGEENFETAPDTSMENAIDLDDPNKEQTENQSPQNTQGINVTDIVNKVDDVEDKVVNNNDDNLSKIMDTISNLESKLGDMEQILSRIDDLEGKIEDTMPKTPEQKLELRSLDSYPYNVKLDDFWKKDIPGYDVDGGNSETFKKSELVLTQDDVDDYSDQEVRDSFSIPDYDSDEEDKNYKFEKKVAFRTGKGGGWR